MGTFLTWVRVLAPVAVIVVLGIGYYLKADELATLKLTHQATLQDLANARAEINGLQAEVSFKEKETKDMNELLSKCYKRVAQHQKDWDSIDKIMELEDGEESCKKEDKDACISRKTGEAGLDFLNRQFDSVR